MANYTFSNTPAQDIEAVEHAIRVLSEQPKPKTIRRWTVHSHIPQGFKQHYHLCYRCEHGFTPYGVCPHCHGTGQLGVLIACQE